MSTEPDHLTQSGTERVVVWLLLRGTTPEAQASVEDWLQQTMTRIDVAGGALLGVLGASVACSFDSVELEDAVDLCISLCHDARAATPALDLCCGLALGEVVSHQGRGPVAVRFGGACIEAAQALAHGGDACEVVIDGAMHERAVEHFLFKASFERGARTGHVLDADHPRRRDCRAAAQALQPGIIPAGAQAEFEQLQHFMTAPGPQRVIVQSESRHQVLDWLARLTGALSPTLLLRLCQQAGGLQPLGGLQAAVRSRFPDAESLARAKLPEDCAGRVRALLEGRSVARQEAVELLTTLLTPRRGRRAWLMLDRVHDVDAASLGVVAEVLGRAELDLVAILAVAPGAKVPAALTAGGAIHNCSLRPLSAADACELAGAVLGVKADSPIARRVATIGGPSSLGVLEAARTLVVSGDLVLDGEGFAWRTEARTGGGGVPVDALFSERVHGMDHDAYRLLEVLSITPPGASVELVTGVAVADGMPAQACAGALRALQREGLADAQGRLGAAEGVVRSALRNGMPPARAAELHRFTARVLAEGDQRQFGAALLAFHLAEGGLEADAAEALLDAAQATTGAGFNRMAVRMAAVAVQFDAREDTRKRAHAFAHRLSAPGGESAESPSEGRPEADAEADGAQPVSTNMAEGAIGRAVQAMCSADYESVESWLDTAVVAGWDPTATRRLRALSQLGRGDQVGATHTLQQAHAADASPAVATREAVCWAVLHLGAGEVEEAICASLSALAAARRAGDDAGEGSALHLLAACYDAVDRGDEAAQLRSAADG